LHRFDYRIELFNIFELCLHNSLFSILSGGDANQVQISAHQFERLERMLSQSDARGIEKMIHTSLKRLQYALQIHDPQTVDYMNQCSRELIGRILNAAKHDNLQSVIITDRPEKIKPVVMSIHTSNRMSDVRLRQLLDEVIRSETKEEKIRLIKSNFSSLHDYLDLLESDCLYGDEYEALYASFGDVELAILSKIVFYEELRGGDTELRTIVFQKKRAEFDWQVHLIEFMKRLSPSRVHTIEQLIDSICYEDIKFN
ncbi:MAG: DUF6179 domain-containing protein, partial [Alicyclobacillus shizuokensis]|nr:DUF6179 domain-containing protein [Alicyclobacillus shizuokensis]